MKNTLFHVISLLAAALLLHALAVSEIEADESGKTGGEEYKVLPKPGEKVTLDSEHYFIYGFDRQPKMGAVIMKVEIFKLDGQQDTSFTVKGDLDMPSMRGAHSSGEMVFSKSKKGSYLLPANIAMPGDWEFRFVFEKNEKKVMRGAYLFDV